MRHRADIRLLARCDALIHDFQYRTGIVDVRLDYVEGALTDFKIDLARKCPHDRLEDINSCVDDELLGRVCSVCRAVFPPTDFT
jgi:hypothetical protein